MLVQYFDEGIGSSGLGKTAAERLERSGTERALPEKEDEDGTPRASNQSSTSSALTAHATRLKRAPLKEEGTIR